MNLIIKLYNLLHFAIKNNVKAKYITNQKLFYPNSNQGNIVKNNQNT